MRVSHHHLGYYGKLLQATYILLEPVLQYRRSLYRCQYLLSGARDHQHGERHHHIDDTYPADFETSDVNQKKGSGVRNHAAWKLVSNLLSSSQRLAHDCNVCVASIVRIYYLAVFVKTVDITWLMGPVFIWSSVEPSIGILSACLPNLRPLFRGIRQKTSSAERSSSADRIIPSNGDAPWRFSGNARHNAGTRGSSFGGSRFSFGGDGTLKLVEEEDEIHLTNRATGGSRMQEHGSTASEEESLPGHVIMIESRIEQSSCARNERT